MVPDEYDYCKNSIYKAFLANDSVSDEILLRHHYRCSKQIIQFNNMKYYNNRLNIESRVQSENPLVFMEVQDNRTDYKNTAPREAEKNRRICKSQSGPENRYHNALYQSKGMH
uniref:hypothetical protein n=1 Tax=Clostridium sp. NkU-1 TaxID=1095009 RepID=UPI000AA4E139